MVVISAPPYFPEQARQIQRNFAPGALTEVEMNRMRQVHKHGQPQIDQLFAMVRGLPDNDDDVNFTPAVLSTIAAETLIVFGDRDFLYPVSIAWELHESIKGSYLWVVPNGGHGPVFGDRAPQFAKTAVEFLRGDWRRPPQ
jgi:pimeloyl-ACP methyl ester carboxylesterase